MSGPSFRIFSDLDDTIKISNTQEKLVTFYRGVFRSSAFTGMAELYQEWVVAAADANAISIISSSPPMLRNRIKSFLEKNKFPAAELRLRNWITQPFIVRYKTEAIEALASKYPEPLILVGDDTEHDPEVLLKFREQFPKRVLAIYIRQVKGGKLAEGITPFFTAFDIACAEVCAGRLTTKQADLVGRSILETKKRRRLLPRFTLKPPMDFVPKIPHDNKRLQELWLKIQKKLQQIPERSKKIK